MRVGYVVQTKTLKDFIDELNNEYFSNILKMSFFSLNNILLRELVNVSSTASCSPAASENFSKIFILNVTKALAGRLLEGY